MTHDGRRLALHALDVQLDLLHYYIETPMGRTYAETITELSLEAMRGPIEPTRSDIELLAKLMHGNIFSGEVYAVTDEILDVLEAAAPTIPSFDVLEHDLPAPSGFIYFERPVYCTDRFGKPLALRGFGWWLRHQPEPSEEAMALFIAEHPDATREQLIELVKQGPILLLALLTDPSDERDHLHEEWLKIRVDPLLTTPPRNLMTMLAAICTVGEAEAPEFNAKQMPWRLFLSFLRFIQERWVTNRMVDPDRSRVKRSLRATKRKPPSTRVVQLRRSEQRSHHTEGDGPGEVEWSCRWLVHGHWRMQAHGPNRSLRRPMWIAEHIKGPEDKPLIVHEDIFSVER